MRLLRSMIPVLLLLLGGYGLVCLLMYLSQEKLVFYPSPLAPGPPPDPAAHDVELVTSDGVRLHGWVFEAREPRAVLVFCHGNAGNVAGRAGAARLFREMGLTVVLFDYRGYGRSAGTPSEEGTYLDALAAYDHARTLESSSGRIVLFGESLGGAVAIELASQREVARLVVESTFTSVPDLAATLYAWLPVRLLARVRYDNASKIGALEPPLLIVHSPEDELVPFSHATRLLSLAPPATELLRTSGGHNDGGFLQRREWIERVGAFLAAAGSER